MEERRRFPRWSVCDKVFYKKQGCGEECECLSKDISYSGMCFSLPEAVTPNTELDLRMQLCSDSAPIQAKGTVRWVSPSKNVQENLFLAGVKFNLLKDIDKDTIFNYAFQFRKQEIINRWWQKV